MLINFFIASAAAHQSCKSKIYYRFLHVYFDVNSSPTIPTSVSKAKNILNNEAESPKKRMPISKVPIAPNPVQMMYAVLTGIALWAKYRNTPLNAMLMIANVIQTQKRSG